MQQGFDWIAPFYDSLARLVYGESIRRCQLEYLDKIPADSNVLIIGGGTGWILTELAKINPTCRVYYIEASIKMLEKTRARFVVPPSNELVFIHGTEANLDQLKRIRFDSVITNFYLDVFDTASLTNVLDCIGGAIARGGQLLISDFVNRRWWHRVSLFVMYRFFRWTCSVKAKRLPTWEDQLRKNGFTERTSKSFFGGFIKSSLYVFD
jgi:ubiquinone/menaquinone biosynthesis C-methylase UbiE